MLVCASSTMLRTAPLIKSTWDDERAVSIPTRDCKSGRSARSAKGLREYTWGWLDLDVAEEATKNHYLLVSPAPLDRRAGALPLLLNRGACAAWTPLPEAGGPAGEFGRVFQAAGRGWRRRGSGPERKWRGFAKCPPRLLWAVPLVFFVSARSVTCCGRRALHLWRRMLWSACSKVCTGVPGSLVGEFCQ